MKGDYWVLSQGKRMTLLQFLTTLYSGRRIYGNMNDHTSFGYRELFHIMSVSLKRDGKKIDLDQNEINRILASGDPQNICAEYCMARIRCNF